ncbi:MAG: dihydroneopterin aldolase [Chitinophagaceae bacterium]|nr:dihydroneopterin aldolase [Chitinophagaceae bacterium]
MAKEENIIIELNKLRFFAFHGVYEEEIKTGNEFEINAKVSFDTKKEVINKLKETINYVSLYAIIKEVMDHRENLLETIVMKIVTRMHEEFPAIDFAEVQLIKLHPPIVNFMGNVSVTCRKEF